MKIRLDTARTDPGFEPVYSLSAKDAALIRAAR